MNSDTEPRIVEFGPDRLIGVSRVCKTSADCHEAWEGENSFMARAGEIQAREAQTPYYAVCRCAKGAEPGAFEYVAAVPAAEGAPVPEDLVEVVLPAGTYAEFLVAGLGDIGRVWGYTGEWLAAHQEWKGFCDGNPDGCECVDHPSFELYPPGYDGGELFIYAPIRAASV
jgi:predicted transcriptional regulator YdeE